MAVPKRKTSRARRDKRRSSVWKLSAPGMTKCPKCGAKVIERKTKRGYTFYGCSNWPGCDFMTWDKPTDEICPQCGKSLFKKKGGVVECLNEGCGYTKKSARKGKKTDE